MNYRVAGVVLAAAVLSLSLQGRLTAAEPADPPGEMAAETVLPAEQIPFFHTYNLTALFPVGAAAIGQAGFGGEVLTLDDCIDYALAGNPTHAKARENMRGVKPAMLVAWGNYIPTLSSSYGLSQSNRTSSFLDPSGVLRTSGGISKSSYASLRMNLNIFDSARHYFDLKNARYFRRQRESQLSASELNLVDQMRRAYINALRQQQLLTAAESQAENRREQLRLAEARHSVGSVTRLDVLQAQVDLKDQELVIIQRQNDLAQAKMQLNRLMGRALEAVFGVVDQFDVDRLELDLGRMIDYALANHPDIAAIDYQVRQQRNNLWMGRLDYLPTISTSLNYSRTDEGLELIPNRDKGRGLSFGISWNIWDSFQRYSRNRTLEIQLNNLVYDLEAARMDIEQDIRAFWLDLQQLYESHLALAESRDLRQQSLELEQERYRLGAASLLDLRQAQTDFSQAEVNYINSKYEFHTALSNLSGSVGRRVESLVEELR
ncbi:MAG: TolC family protein [Candidatus Glassbacteria bacterium]|nr:TolC family protein [Candidatus Glassbacteria bacterium]